MSLAPHTAAVYAARMDVDDDFLERFEQWYRDKHGPDLLRSGFFSCVAYHAIVGSPLVHNLYHIPSADIFESPKYQSARTPVEDPQRPEVLSHVSNRSNTPYRQAITEGVSSASPIVAEFVVGIECSTVSPDDDALGHVEAFARSLAPAVQAWRLCVRDGIHPANPQRPWHAFVVLECATLDEARAAFEVASERADEVGGAEISLLARRIAMLSD